MGAARFVVGLDFGTESARGLLLDIDTGAALASDREAYASGVMDTRLADGTALPADWALQDADDYLHAAERLLRRLSEAARERGGAIAGIGIDCTASTVLPTRADGAPLSRDLPGEPHAYVKLWKHHAAQPWAERIDAAGGDYLRYTGGATSCEWLPAKAAQLRAEAPAVWARAERFIEAGDWLVSQLVGHEVRSTCQAGYKAHYRDGAGYPEALERLVPGLRARLGEPVAIGQAAGTLCTDWCRRTGLDPAPTIAVATVDAHAVVPAVGVTRPRTLVASLGTSACHLMVDEACHPAPGLAGVVRDGILPGLWGYEAGQAGFGDLLAWFVRACPAGADAAASFRHYNAGAAGLRAGGSGILALDWWNGCRTPLMDPALSGVFVGMTLRTTRVELYRALLESLCFGTRRVVETFCDGGLAVDELVVASGLAEKNPYIAQLIADVTGRAVRLPRAHEATARGAAIHAAVAAGLTASFEEAAVALGAQGGATLEPEPAAVAVYDELYAMYRELSDYFHRSGRMADLRRLRGG